nr:ribonuclease H-like domain-containing protein [Tanacetum cinerariifolium]
MFGHMLLALEGKNKTGFIDGSCKRSNVDEVLGRQWDRVNEDLKETYDKVDDFVTFHLHHKINTLKHYGSTLADYYHGLNAVWKQFDCLIELPRCTCHAAEGFKKHNQLMKLMQFLMGLDDSYMSIRSSILSRDPFSDAKSAYAKCFKIIGYPADFGKKKNGQNFNKKINSNNTIRSNTSFGFIDDQLSTVISLIKDNTLTGNNVQANMEDYPGMPNDEESVDPSPNGDSRTNSDSGHSPVSGETVDTDDIPDTGIDADINEIIYMKQPQGYYLVDGNKSKSDYSLFTKSEKDIFLAFLVYVDDIIIPGNNVFEIEKFKDFLKSNFQIKNLGKLNYFLGIEVIDTDKGICLNQRKYVLDLLTKYGMLACKPARTPMMSKLSISNEATNNGLFFDNIVDYQKLMRKLIYLTNTRFDISYVVYCLSQFMHAPLRSYLKSAFKILRYLNGSPGLGIHITRESSRSLKAYSDADWAKCTVTKKSVTGYCVFINNNLIS